SPLRAPRGLPPVVRPSVVAEGVDQLALVHPRATFEADVLGFLHQLLLGTVLVARAPTALAPGRAPAARIGDPGRPFLARALTAQCLVLLVVFHRGAVVLRHLTLPVSWSTYRFPVSRAR